MKGAVILEEDQWRIIYFDLKNKERELRQVIWAPEFAHKAALADMYENICKLIEPVIPKPDSSQQKITRFTNKER